MLPLSWPETSFVLHQHQFKVCFQAVPSPVFDGLQYAKGQWSAFKLRMREEETEWVSGYLSGATSSSSHLRVNTSIS